MLVTTLLHNAGAAASGILTDNLVLHLDAADTNSYNPANTSKIWTDISQANSSKLGVLNADARHSATHGGYILFDGTDDWVNFAADDDFAFGQQDFTVQYVARVNSPGGTIFDTRASRSAEGFSDYITKNNATSVTINAFSKAKKTYYSSIANPNLGTWYSFTYTRQSGSFRAYIDGSLDIIIAGIDTNFDSRNLRLGANIEGKGFHGGLGVVLIYKGKALNQDEVKHNHDLIIQRFKS